MSGGVRARPAELADAPRLAAILNDVVDEPGATAIDRHLTAAELADWFLRGEHVIACTLAELTAGEETRPVGFQTLERFHELPQGWADIGTYVDAAARRAGAGRAMTRATVDAARAAGLHRVRAAIGSRNDRAIAFYRARGFRPLAADESQLAVPGCATHVLEVPAASAP